MCGSISRRSLLRSGASLAVGIGLLGTTASGSDTTTTTVQGGNVTASVRQYDEPERRGALPEDVTYAPSIRIADVHTLLWNADWGDIKDVREDARESTVARPTGPAPELEVENEVFFDAPYPMPSEFDYEATIRQAILVAKEYDALLVDSNVEFQSTYFPTRDWQRDVEHTAYTIWNPEIDVDGDGGDFDYAWRDTWKGFDVAVADAGGWAVAYARQQYRPWLGRGREQEDGRFDGCRLGVEGSTSASDQSAWHDIYEEEDGWIDGNDRARGDVDVGVGTYAAEDPGIRWLETFGFGRSWRQAAEQATASIESGYADQRAAWE